MEDIHMNRVGLKLQLGRAACMLFAVVLLFATSGKANALQVTVQWSFLNTPTTATPTDTIEMRATVEIFGDANAGLYVTGFQAVAIEPGTLIGAVGGISNLTDNPYNIDLQSGGFDPWFGVSDGPVEFTFGILTPQNGIPLDTYSSGLGDVTFLFNDDYFIGTPSLNIFTVNVVPEPSTMLLLGSGLAGLAFFRMRRKREA